MKHKKLILLVMCALFLSLWLNHNVNAEEGYRWGLAIKLGAANMDAPTGDDSKTRFKFDIEGASPRFFNKYVDCFAEFGWAHLESEGEMDVAYQYDLTGTYIPDTETKYELDLYEIRLGLRIYPHDFSFSNDKWRIVPYIGGGGGYFWSRTTERSKGDKTGSTVIGGSIYNLYEIEEDHETKADGLFPFITCGVNIQYNKHIYFGTEIKYDFNKNEDNYDYEGFTFSGVLGIKW